MAFAGLRKQINKANQYVSEKMGGAEGTKLDDEFTEMERVSAATTELCKDVPCPYTRLSCVHFERPKLSSSQCLFSVRIDGCP